MKDLAAFASRNTEVDPNTGIVTRKAQEPTPQFTGDIDMGGGAAGRPVSSLPVAPAKNTPVATTPNAPVVRPTVNPNTAPVAGQIDPNSAQAIYQKVMQNLNTPPAPRKDRATAIKEGMDLRREILGENPAEAMAQSKIGRAHV